MKEIKNVLICGLGAIGSIYAIKIQEHNPDCIKVLLDETRLDRYKKDGIIFNEKRYDFDYVLDSCQDFKADLILIATKSTDFEQAAEMIRNFVGEKTIIMSLLNGISSEEILIEKYGCEKVVYSYFLGSASMKRGNKISFDGNADIFFGDVWGESEEVNGKTMIDSYRRSTMTPSPQSSPLKGEEDQLLFNINGEMENVKFKDKEKNVPFTVHSSQFTNINLSSYQPISLSANVQSIKEFFDKVGIDYKIPDDMQSSRWQKFIINIGANQTLAITRTPYGGFKNQYIRNIAQGLMSEATEIARFLEIKNCDKFIENAFKLFDGYGAEMKPSMLQDVENKRPTEVDIFAGEVCRLGKKYNIPTPKNELAFEILKSFD